MPRFLKDMVGWNRVLHADSLSPGSESCTSMATRSLSGWIRARMLSVHATDLPARPPRTPPLTRSHFNNRVRVPTNRVSRPTASSTGLAGSAVATGSRLVKVSLSFDPPPVSKPNANPASPGAAGLEV
jgi:hypothetical protein